MTVMTSREFSEDVEKAKDAALDGPVIIVDRGREAYVLMTAEEFRQGRHVGGPRPSGAASSVAGRRKTIAELLSSPEIAEIEFDLPERTMDNQRPLPDFSDDT
ncbi:prevent-host-death protein [Rhizobium sp. RU36D]|uniref:prevent-host-death protein n=1 Tax=Rhizobium sp. RU36D TaxID=1907415 RepID=UPI0009D807FC|nr:prevent-host-death protein [Rhizobium sp. RU36D]SMD03128.1 hypothetical protein SAMN05880593_11687 [Rhizobium sp. RU36D]